MKQLFLFVFLCFGSASIARADNSLQLIKSIPIAAHILQVDELGNAYVVRNDNTFIKFNEAGDSLLNFMSVSNGNISYVDVTNPLRILLYYPGFAQLLLLDRMLSPKNELNLRKLNLLNSNVIALSADGNLWVYDQFNATLNKLDMELNYMIRGNDLRQQLSESPRAAYLVERDRKVYMADTAQGILIFDQYGSYLNTLSIFGVKQLQIVGSQIIYRRGNTLFAYDLKNVKETEITIPEHSESPILQAAYCRNVLYVLYADRLELYHSQN